MSYRSKWYSERGLEYEPPKLGDCLPFRCLGSESEELYRNLTGGKLGKPRQREPGQDWDEVAA